MELRKWSYDYVGDIAGFADNGKIADNLRDTFPHPYTEEDARRFVAFCLENPEDRQVHRVIFHDGRAVGGISLTLGEDIYAKSAEIGYWLAEEYWGRGIAAEAVAAMCRIGFERYGLARIFAAVFAYNAASCRVLEKCGFVMEGLLRKSVYKNGRFFDSCLYSLIE